MILKIEVIEAAHRILDPNPGHPYGQLRISGDPAVYAQFYKDVSLLAETIAQIAIESVPPCNN